MTGQEIKALAVQTDTALSLLYKKYRWASAERFTANDSIRRYYSKVSPNDSYALARKADLDATAAAAKEKMHALRTEMEPFEAIYEQHKWTRAFLVVSSAGGHVHKSMSCSTCYPETEYVWLPDYSGSDESQIVEDAGMRACTVCYPSAPVSILSRPTKIYSDDERKSMVARDERAKAKIEREAKRAAKAPTKSGQPLVIVLRSKKPWADKITSHKRELKTEVTATSEYMSMAEMLPVYADPSRAGYDLAEYESTKDAMALIEAALAEKHGVSVEQERARLAAKVAAKRKRESR